MNQPDTNVLIERFGPLMCSKDVQQALRFKTPEGFRAARTRGRLPLTMFRLPGRRGLFAKTSDVAELISQQIMSTAEEIM